ncbi:MAG: PGPGW domain-containing protein [Pseudomonadota bacterium]
MNPAYQRARQIVILVVGVSLLVLGVALLVLPGPGLLILAAGLCVLSVEFVWARSWLHKVRRGISQATRKRRLKG